MLSSNCLVEWMLFIACMDMFHPHCLYMCLKIDVTHGEMIQNKGFSVFTTTSNTWLL